MTGLHGALSDQTWADFDWIVVDDGSTDRTRLELEALTQGVAPVVLEKTNDGGLIGGSAYSSWRFGVDRGLSTFPAYSHVMKLDADVRLPADYFEKVVEACTGNVGLAGGVLVGRGKKEQSLHVPGPVKMYTSEALQHLARLPSAIGFDVMDEVALAEAGYSVSVLKNASVHMSRAIGASEGGIHGRMRNGRVCRWTGYYPPYFLLHVLRYAFRRPMFVGSLAMIWGYLRADDGPYDVGLKRKHAHQQKQKLAAAVRSPRKWLDDVYNYQGS